MTCDLWPVACDLWSVTCDMWPLIYDLWHINYYTAPHFCASPLAAKSTTKTSGSAHNNENLPQSASVPDEATITSQPTTTIQLQNGNEPLRVSCQHPTSSDGGIPASMYQEITSQRQLVPYQIDDGPIIVCESPRTPLASCQPPDVLALGHQQTSNVSLSKVVHCFLYKKIFEVFLTCRNWQVGSWKKLF